MRRLMQALPVISFMLLTMTFAEKPAKSDSGYDRWTSCNVLWERNGPDYLVYFLVPANASFSVHANGVKERKVLATAREWGGVPPTGGGVYPHGNWKWVVVSAGSRARYFNYYYGSIRSWANSLVVNWWR